MSIATNRTAAAQLPTTRQTAASALVIPRAAALSDYRTAKSRPSTPSTLAPGATRLSRVWACAYKRSYSPPFHPLALGARPRSRLLLCGDWLQ
ncbi:hypothetical protein DL93DRAFT_2172940 [Clavulina sp. PMI_390]|nr:hypothetical protein DL93DRAFT_2172940 [Clavulina sp. PMI_390]